MNQPLVSIITVNYNQPEVTAALLRSLSLLDYSNWEMIVVDNASPQHSSAGLKKDFPFITHISCPFNLGFAGGNNVGLQVAKGDFVFFVNNDTEVTTELVKVLVNYLQMHPGCAIACPKIKYWVSPDIIQYAGAIGLHPLTSRSYDIGYLQKDDGRFNDCRETDLPNGAAMMIPMPLIKKIGPMSEIFFLYYEELDWVARFKKEGYTTHYVGTAEIFHKDSITTGKNSAFKTFYLYRNRFLYIRRNYKSVRKLVAASFFVFVSIPMHMFKHLTKGEWDHFKGIWSAFMWNCRHKPFEEPATHSSTLDSQLAIT